LIVCDFEEGPTARPLIVEPQERERKVAVFEKRGVFL